MGWNDHIDETEPQYNSSDDLFVCHHCIKDPYLKEEVKANATSKKCSFCERKKRNFIAIDFNDFKEYIRTGIKFSYEDPVHHISYESAEGGYLANLSSLTDIIWDLDVSENEKLTEAICEDFEDGNGYVEKDYYIGNYGERLHYGWSAFSDTVKHQNRHFFHFSADESDPGDIDAKKFLSELADLTIRFSDESIIKYLPIGTSLYRVRIHQKPEECTKATHIGAPKIEHATQPNRMSPAGIPMFYGAFEPDTAIRETYNPKQKKEGYNLLSIGHFKLLKPMLLLDLTELPKVPSIYDGENNGGLYPLQFFHDFAEEISKPIERGDREHVEYAPTQIVSEFFRHIFRLNDDMKLNGIIYKSSRKGGEKAVVLFCENDDACDKGAPIEAHWLELQEIRQTSINQ